MGFLHSIINSRSKPSGNFFVSLRNLLGFKPQDLDLYRLAFTHASTQQTDFRGRALNYERLEFLGDAVLSAVVSGYLFESLPEADEGELTKMRSKLVSRHYLNRLGADFELIEFMKCSDDCDQFGANVYGNLFEALIGAVYMDRGFRYCETFIYQKVIEPHVNLQQLKGKIISYKSHLIEWCQKQKKPFQFQCREETLSGHPTEFKINLKIAGQTLARAQSTSKKKAEEMAAQKAWKSVQMQNSA